MSEQTSWLRGRGLFRLDELPLLPLPTSSPRLRNVPRVPSGGASRLGEMSIEFRLNRLPAKFLSRGGSCAQQENRNQILCIFSLNQKKETTRKKKTRNRNEHCG